jgi:hypothetical protein
MPVRRAKPVLRADMPADHPRIVAAVKAGRRIADEHGAVDSWHDIPPQIPVELTAAATPAELLAIMGAWATAYQIRCEEIEAEHTARMALLRGGGLG